MIDISTVKEGDRVRIISPPNNVSSGWQRKVNLHIGGLGYIRKIEWFPGKYLITVCNDPMSEPLNGVNAYNFRLEHLDLPFEYNASEWSID